MLFRLRKAKREWQEEQWADQRKDKEEAAAKYRKRMEEKAKEREEKNKLTEDCKNDQVPNKQRYTSNLFEKLSLSPPYINLSMYILYRISVFFTNVYCNSDT